MEIKENDDFFHLLKELNSKLLNLDKKNNFLKTKIKEGNRSLFSKIIASFFPTIIFSIISVVLFFQFDSRDFQNVAFFQTVFYGDNINSLNLIAVLGIAAPFFFRPTKPKEYLFDHFSPKDNLLIVLKAIGMGFVIYGIFILFFLYFSILSLSILDYFFETISFLNYYYFSAFIFCLFFITSFSFSILDFKNKSKKITMTKSERKSYNKTLTSCLEKRAYFTNIVLENITSYEKYELFCFIVSDEKLTGFHHVIGEIDEKISHKYQYSSIRELKKAKLIENANRELLSIENT